MQKRAIVAGGVRVKTPIPLAGADLLLYVSTKGGGLDFSSDQSVQLLNCCALFRQAER
jgi:hypothetical protein